MRKEDYDRIIVETYEKTEKVIHWYLKNQDWLDSEEFVAPMDSGLIVLKEEQMEIAFESREDRVEMTVYVRAVNGENVPAFSFDYKPQERLISNYRFPAHLTPERRSQLKKLLEFDGTAKKEAIKYHSLMKFAVYYRDVVKVDETQDTPRSKKVVKRLRRSLNRPVPLVRRTYLIDDFQSEDLRAHGEKRGYTKPEHEVSVKGFYRTSKSGKRTWIKPHSRYKDKGNKQRKDYTI